MLLVIEWKFIVNLSVLAAHGMTEHEAIDAGAIIDQGHAVFVGPSDGYARAMTLCKRKIPVLPDLSRRAMKDDPAWQERKRAMMARVGPPLWAKLHRWALTADLTTAQEWLDDFAKQLPCGDCKRHWRDMIKRAPPDLSSQIALFDWTVERHNEVNERLDRSTMTTDEARATWTA
jgi:hypothetical protein